VPNKRTYVGRCYLDTCIDIVAIQHFTQQAQHFGLEKYYFKVIILVFQLLCYLCQSP